MDGGSLWWWRRSRGFLLAFLLGLVWWDGIDCMVRGAEMSLWEEMGDSEFGGMVSRVLHVHGGC